LIAIVLYVLSMGPVCNLLLFTPCARLLVIYEPLEWLYRAGWPFNAFLEWYVDVWNSISG